MTSSDAVRSLLILLAILVLVPFVAMAIFWPAMGMWGGGHMGSGPWDGTGMPWSWLAMWALLLAIVVASGYLLYRALTSRGGETDPALEELRLAYARGNLSEEEFETRRTRLEDDRNR
ncbi:SHOCT domain-containing protein [Natronosalvus halobius]|uniref:SHOCT domain-containing protein n=1 Tax=Natronosalvus halobius TaxID=2953746 RepID=UPI0020A0B7C7|nr:SHOCT domain-containing protein [Natronosalvus halobius]USZ72636.1 SHOCT domain-containing protein [Natronosalvus halobius]